MKLKVKNKKWNLLTTTIHRKFGMLWTDGVSIFLTPLSQTDDYAVDIMSEVKPKPDSEVTLGNFREVESATWSDITHPHSFLSVILRQQSGAEYIQVQLWQMVSAIPKVKVSLMLTHEFAHQPAVYGCSVWDNSAKKLCLLMKKVATIYYYDAEEMKFELKGRVEPSFGREEFRCACWSHDSKVLLLSFRMGVSLYEADEQGVVILPFITVNLPGIISVTAVSGEAFLCSSELMLENLVTNAKGEPQSLEQLRIDVPSCQGDCSINETLGQLQLSLPENEVAEESACLIIISESGQILSKLNLENIIVPNLLTWLPFHNWCLVGGTNSKQLFLFSVTNNDLSRINEISLPCSNRPKGIVATGESDDSVYVAVTDSSLNQLFPGMVSKNLELQIFYVPFEVLLHKRLMVKEDETLATTSCSMLSLNPRLSSSSFKKGIKETSSPSNSNMDVTLQKVFNLLFKECDMIDKQRKSPEEEPDVENAGVESTSSTLSIDSHLLSGSISPTENVSVYQALKDIECVTVHCEIGDKSVKQNRLIKDIMLLPGGKLKLQTLLDTFNIQCVELYTGTKFMIISNTDDGCLPIRFQNGEKIWLRAQERYNLPPE